MLMRRLMRAFGLALPTVATAHEGYDLLAIDVSAATRPSAGAGLELQLSISDQWNKTIVLSAP